MGRRKTLEQIKETAEQNHPGITSLLGRYSASFVAKRYGLSRSWIHQLRLNLQIPPPSRLTIEEKYPGILSSLGRYSDTFVAKRYGLSRGRIFQLRSNLQIPPYRNVSGPEPLASDDYALTVEKRYPGILSCLGLVQDNQIACHYGVSPQMIFGIRKRLSIPRLPRNAPSVWPFS